MSKGTKDSTTTVYVVSAIVFLLFVFCFVTYFQATLLSWAQYVWSDGTTSFQPFIGGIIFSVVLLIISLGIKVNFRLPPFLSSLCYFPSLFILGVLTSVEPEGAKGATVGHWAWISVIVFIIYFLILKFLEPLTDIKSRWSGFIEVLVINVFMQLSQIGICCCISNTHRLLHNQLNVERAIAEGDYDRALEIGSNDTDASASLTMFRAFALSNKGELGERLFEYELAGSSQTLLPASDTIIRSNHITSDTVSLFSFTDDRVFWKHLGAVPAGKVRDVRLFLRNVEAKGINTAVVSDYILTSYLLDGDLNGFAMEVSHRFNPESLDSLPKHYREALILYSHTHSNRVLTYSEEVLDADYQDLTQLSRAKYKNAITRMATIRNTYNGTYWYYYLSHFNPSKPASSRGQTGQPL